MTWCGRPAGIRTRSSPRRTKSCCASPGGPRRKWRTEMGTDMGMELWHNPRCSKSRAAKAALDQAGVAYTERRYLDDPPTVRELDEVLTTIGAEPWDIARMTEPVAEELDLKNLE